MSSSVFLRVTVTDPLKQSDTFGAYITYRVSTSTNSAEFSSQECSVTRRYSDFEWLHDQLSYFNPGSIIPTLPEKQTVGRFEPQFIESRRRGIEKFMQRISKHPILKDSACVSAFLQADAAGFTQLKAQYKQERAAAEGSVSSWLGDKINVLSSSGGVGEETEDDTLVQGALDYALAWEKQMTTVAKHSSDIVKSSRDKAAALFEFGQAFSSLGLNEPNRELGDVLSKVGVASAKLSGYTTEAAESEAAQFEEPMHECVRLLGEIKNAVKRRGDKKQNLQTAIADLNAKQAAYNKVLGAPGKEDQATQKLVLVEAAQERVEKATTELNDVSKLVVEEVNTFKVEKAADFKSACREYVQVLIKLNSNIEEVWAGLIPELQQVLQNAPSSSGVSSKNPFEEPSYSPPPPPPPNSSAKSSSSSYYEEEEQKEYSPPPPSVPQSSNFSEEIDIDEEDEAGV